MLLTACNAAVGMRAESIDMAETGGNTGELVAGLPVVRSVAALRAHVAAWRKNDDARVGLTPTMGALHEGHLSLVTRARAADGGRATRVVASLFVNPTQFGPNEDFDAYPRDEARDAGLLREAGCDLLFAPTLDEMYPPDFSTRVSVDGVSEPLCGAGRPGHFDGVAQVVSKLLNQAQADVAVFGEKDWQQLAVIRRMARDLDIPTEILGAPIIRADDGLALSSRNAYLSEPQRAAAPALFQNLTRTADQIASGEDPAGACAAAASAIVAAGFASVDYVEARDADTLELIPKDSADGPARIFGAARIGRARLLDNVPIPKRSR